MVYKEFLLKKYKKLLISNYNLILHPISMNYRNSLLKSKLIDLNNKIIIKFYFRNKIKNLFQGKTLLLVNNNLKNLIHDFLILKNWVIIIGFKISSKYYTLKEFKNCIKFKPNFLINSVYRIWFKFAKIISFFWIKFILSLKINKKYVK